jgi:hypothetical protein
MLLTTIGGSLVLGETARSVVSLASVLTFHRLRASLIYVQIESIDSNTKTNLDYP